MAKKRTVPTKASATKSKKQGRKVVKPITKKKQIKNNQQQQHDVQLSDLSENAPSEEGVSDQENQQSSGSQQDSEDGSDSENSQQQSEQESSITPVKPQNYAVKQMQFRQRRGTKMSYLMARKKQQEEDPFWTEHKGYFGDLNASDEEDEEDYVEDSSGKDDFDSDFGQTQSEHEQEQEDKQEGKKMIEQSDEQKLKQKKRRAELMKKINVKQQKPLKNESNTQKKKLQKGDKTAQKHEPQKTDATLKKAKPQKQKIQQEIGNRYIHQMFTQEQLLGEAAHTEYYNWLSLKKLISIETQKKDFTRKVKHVEGEKVIYRNRRNEQGNNATTYELCGVAVNQISDLTNYWLAN